MPAITRIISITNFAVASSALCFQVGVLYPWHKELDENFEKLKKEHLMVLDVIKNNAELAAAREAAIGASRVGEAKSKGLREWLGLGTRTLE
ncbi:hypothetical protein N0V82_010594 [Gnomoniopsis sp. IMI 355080]|nr:hypothetical protein N0V82_010594 [Gnomoniopsis sp. IMI 355080]